MTQKHKLGKILVDQTEYETDRWIADHAVSEWTPLCPDYPNILGVTCDEIEQFIVKSSAKVTRDPEYDAALLQDAPPSTKSALESIIHSSMSLIGDDPIHDYFLLETGEMPRRSIEQYLRHVKCLSRDDIHDISRELYQQIVTKYPDAFEQGYEHMKLDPMERKISKPSTIFVTTPRGGYAALSIFAYANNIPKRCIPSDIISESTGDIRSELTRLHKHIRNLEKETKQTDKEKQQHIDKHAEVPCAFFDSKLMGLGAQLQSAKTTLTKYEGYQSDPSTVPKFGIDWLESMSEPVKHVFIIDDIIASGEQVGLAVNNIHGVFGDHVTIVPVMIAGRERSSYADLLETPYIGISPYNPPIIGVPTVGMEQYMETHEGIITVRFPWGSPDGIEDRVLWHLYGERFITSRRARRSLHRRPSESEDVNVSL